MKLSMKLPMKHAMLLGVLLAMLLQTGCTPIPQKFRNALLLDSSYKNTKGVVVDTITILPLIDARIDQTDKLDLVSDMGDTAKGLLEEKGYDAIISNSNGSVEKVTVDMLQSAKPGWIKRLGPGNARWVMVLRLETLLVDAAFTTKAHAVATGYMFDKKTLKTIWYDKVTMNETAKGLYGAMFLTNSFSVRAVTTMLLASIPTRGEAKIKSGKSDEF